MSGKSLNKQVIFNTLSYSIITGIGFLTTPVFTRLLGTIQYGKYSVFYSWVAIIACVMGFQTHNSIANGSYDYKDQYYSFRSGLLIIGTIISGGIIFVLGILAIPLSSWLGYSIPVYALLLISAYAHYVVDFSRTAFIYEKKAVANFIVSTLISIVTVVLSLLLFSCFNEDSLYLSRVYGVSFPYAVAALILVIALFIRQPSLPKKEYWRYSLVIGGPLVFHALSSRVLGQADCIMLDRIGNDQEAVGLYSFFHTYTSVLSVILTALNNSWVPFLFDDLRSKQEESLKSKTNHYLELFTLVCVVYLLMSREVCYIFADESYFVGMDIIPVFTVAIYFTFMYQFSVNYEIFCKKTGIIAIGTCITALINIILNGMLIPIWGYLGAAIATALSYLGLFIAHYLIASKLQNGKPYVSLFSFVKWLMPILIAVVLFYYLKDMFAIRWIIAIALGVVCIGRIIKRRAVF